MVLAAPAMDLELRLSLVEGKGDGDELVLVVSLAIVVRNDNARVANLHFGPVIFSEGINAKQSFASIVSKNGEKFLHKCSRGGGSAGADSVSVGPYSESILNRDCSQSRDHSELHGKHFATGGHPRRRNDLVSKGNDVFHGLVVHEVCSAFDLDIRLIGSDGMMTVLEVKAEGQVSRMLEEGVANRTIDNING